MAAHKADESDGFVFIYDRREKDAPEIKLPTKGLTTFKAFKEHLQKTLGLKSTEKYVIATSDREEIKDSDSWDLVENGETLYLLHSLDQELCAPAQERVNYLPHYDTIVKGGMYEYYASEGQNPLPYAFAELIDNSLAATRNNTGHREIEIRLHFDDATMYVIDNGKGMTSRQLNNWAIYRLSKFNKRERKNRGNLDDSMEEDESFVDQNLPKSLNSDISYFGVGGKQAIFFIGNSTRMISRPLGSQDVHELTISKEEFEKKERNNEEIYSGFIRKRKLGDASHIPPEDEILRKLVEEEEKLRDHFTVVVIQGISKEHLQYLRERMAEWTRQLAHIYHYYLHGPSGNVDPEQNERAPSPFKNIDIQIKLWLQRKEEPRIVDLRKIDDDMQTQFVRSAASSFEFKALIDGAKVEGVLRYHPFLYDRETYPVDIYERMEATFEDEHDYAITETPARGRKPIFECFWNGRLIPYTMIDSFEWCNPPKKSKTVPAECYNRVSGVLWTDDNFQVSTNKLTFIDLELKLRDKLAVFTRSFDKQERRTAIEKEFISWLKECHELYDKSIHFTQYQGQVVRLDLPKQRQSPWASYKQVEWDGKTFRAGQLVKISRTLPTLMGTINRVLLYGDHTGDTYATGGDLEIIQEPSALYSEVKIVPLSKLDRTASQTVIKKYIEEEEGKLPSDLEITWPEGNEVVKNSKRRIGEPIGDIKVEILNKKGDKISKLPGKDNASKKLLVELKLMWQSPSGLQTLVSHISQFGKNWGYWFRKMENIQNIGTHIIQLQAILNESGQEMFAGKQLPGEKITFQVVEGEAEKFSVGTLEGPFRVGVPFSIRLDLQDSFGNPAKVSSGKAFLPMLEASGLEISYGTVVTKGHTLTIKDVIGKGQVQGNSGKNFNLNISIPEMNNSSQVLKIRLLPGPATELSVIPEDIQTVVNGTCPNFRIQLHDSAGNPTALEGKQSVLCKLTGASGLPSYTIECSNTGSGTLMGDSILLKKLKGETVLTARFDVQGTKLIQTVERQIKVVPSGKPCEIQVFYQEDDMKSPVQITNNMEITKTAGDMLQGLTFTLFNEAEQEIPLDEKLISKLKINWMAKPPKDVLLKGKLPPIKATNSVIEAKYCQVVMTESGHLDLSFVLKTLAGEPHTLSCSCSDTHQISIGQPLAGEIHIVVRDKFGNEIKHESDKVCKDLKITGDDLKVDLCKVTLDKLLRTMIIKGVVFEGGKIGRKELLVTWRNLKEYVRLEMVAGPPAKMKFVHYGPDEEVMVYNESKLPKALAVQLLDEGENPAKVADVRMQLARDAKLKLIPNVQPTKTNKDGVADFGIFTVSCGRGIYELQPKAFISAGFMLSGPKLKINVQPDPTRPSNLVVSYNNKAAFTAGQIIPEFTVKVFAEDESLLASAKSSHVSLKLWKSEDADATSLPSRTLSYNPETSRKSETGVFNFKNIKAPDEAGGYNIMFVYYDGKHQVFSNVIPVKIEPADPVSLVTLENPGTATVSNTKNYASRCLVRNLPLELRDKYGNHVKKGMNGSVVLEVESLTKEKELPLFVGAGKSKTLNATLAGGTCLLQNIALQENSPGKDGCEYQLKCTVNCSNIPKSQTIEPYIIPFLFYDDAKKQSEMAELSRERDNLQNAIKTYKSLFETTEQLIEELKISVKEAKSEEMKIREELRRQKYPASSLNSEEGIDKLVRELNEKKDQELDKKRRMCSLPTIMANDPEVLGKIGHLAQIPDDDAARVLSWHMSSDMDCVVTMTTKKAKEIYNQTHGRQQVLPLDSIFKKSLTEWAKPLPHVKYKPAWKPTGNLMFARNLLTFPQNEDKCRTVFSMLLGDTLWIDTLDQANEYRRELVKFTNCPTILTREGDRIRSNGKFGGLMNKAPPVEKLRGAVFGAPVPETYHQMCSTIDTLQNLKSALVAHQTAETELQEQMDTIKAPEMQAKYEECREVEKQLQELEKKLGVTTPLRTVSLPKIVKRTPDREDDGPANKRVKVSPALTEVNGTPNNNFLTPTRTSRRIAAMTPTTDSEGRKRLKRS